MDRIWKREETYNRGGKQLLICSDLYPMPEEERSRLREKGERELARLFRQEKSKNAVPSDKVRQELGVWDV